MPYYERRIKSGRVLEVFRYFSLRPAGANIPRGKNQKKSSAAQLVRNYVNAKKNLVRIVNANFGPGDLFITLTYEVPPPSPATAKKDLAKYIRRLREYGKRNKITVKWIHVTEYREGSRPHHHMIISGIGGDMARLLWQSEPDPARRGKRRKWAGHGRAPNDTLDSSGDYEFLARYISKEDKPGEHRWTGSRNLVRPEVEPPREITQRAMTRARNNPTAPRGYRLAGWDYRAGADGHEVLYLRCIRKPNRKAVTYPNLWPSDVFCGSEESWDFEKRRSKKCWKS